MDQSPQTGIPILTHSPGSQPARKQREEKKTVAWAQDPKSPILTPYGAHENFTVHHTVLPQFCYFDVEKFQELNTEMH